MSFSKLVSFISDVGSFISNWIPWNISSHPEWLMSMQGDSPLLGRSEWEYIATVRQSIIQNASSRPTVPSDQHLTYKLSPMKDNFEKVVRHLKENANSEDYFRKNYPQWKMLRDSTILQLNDIAKALNINREESAESRISMSSLSLAGGLICLVPGLGALRLVGGVLMGLGSLAAAGASIIELEVLRKRIKEAEVVMLQDKRYSEKLWNWMNDVSYIQEAYNTFETINVDRNLKNVARELFCCFSTKTAPEELRKLIEISIISLKVPFGLMNEIADVIAMLISIYMLHDRYRPIFKVVFETYKCKRMLNTAYNVVATAAKMSSAIHAGKNVNLTGFQKSGIGIGIALDIISIILAAEDLKSKSKEAAEIYRAAGRLKEEAEIYKKLYATIME